MRSFAARQKAPAANSARALVIRAPQIRDVNSSVLQQMPTGWARHCLSKTTRRKANRTPLASAESAKPSVDASEPLITTASLKPAPQGHAASASSAQPEKETAEKSHESSSSSSYSSSEPTNSVERPTNGECKPDLDPQSCQRLKGDTTHAGRAKTGSACSSLDENGAATGAGRGDADSGGSNASVYGEDEEEDEDAEGEDEDEPGSSYCSHDAIDPLLADANLPFIKCVEFWRGMDDMQNLNAHEIRELFSNAPEQIRKFYQQELFASAGLDPGEVTAKELDGLPTTVIQSALNGNHSSTTTTTTTTMSSDTTTTTATQSSATTTTTTNPDNNNTTPNDQKPTKNGQMDDPTAQMTEGVTYPPPLLYSGQVHHVSSQATMAGFGLQPNSLAANAAAISSTLAAALAQVPGSASQPQSELLAQLPYAGLPHQAPIVTDPNYLAITAKFVQMAKDAHQASASTSEEVHGDRRTVGLQTLPDSDYPPFYAFQVAQQHNQQLMFVDQSSQVAYYNFADLPASKSGFQVEDSKPEGTLRLVIQNFSKMTDTVRGPSKIVQNVPWRIMIMPRQHIVQKKGTQKCLGFFLQCCPDAYSDSWSCNAAAELRLISQKQGIPNFSRKTNHNYTSKENDWGYSCFMTWADILDEQQGYIHDDTVILEVHVKADEAQNVMTLEEFRKKMNGYIRLAQMQCDRGLIDKAIDCNTMALKMCKDRDPECSRKLQAQNAELVARKLKQSIARIERGSDAVVEPDPAANITALRIAMTGGANAAKVAQTARTKRKEPKEADRKRRSVENNPPANPQQNGLPDPDKQDKQQDEELSEGSDDQVCDNPDHPPKCLCNELQLERLADPKAAELRHKHGEDQDECSVLENYDSKTTFDSFEELVARESPESRRLVDALFATPEDKAALLAAVNRARRGESTPAEEADRFSLPMRFELLARSLICDGGFTFADIVQKESDALLKVIAHQAKQAVEAAVQPGLDEQWRATFENLRALAEDEHLQAEPLFELSKSEMARLQQRIGLKATERKGPAEQRDAEAQTEFPSLSKMKERQEKASLAALFQQQSFTQDQLYHFAASAQQPAAAAPAARSTASSAPRRTLTPRTKKAKTGQEAAAPESAAAEGQRPHTPVGTPPQAPAAAEPKKENRKRKERPQQDQPAEEAAEYANPNGAAPLPADVFNLELDPRHPTAAFGNIKPENMEQIQHLIQLFNHVNPNIDVQLQKTQCVQHFDNLVRRGGQSRSASATVDVLARAGALFASAVLHLQEASRQAMETKNVSDLPKALEILTKFCVENKVGHNPQNFVHQDAVIWPPYDLNNVYQLAHDVDGERKLLDMIDTHFAAVINDLKTAPNLVQLAKDIVVHSQKLQAKLNEAHKDVEQLRSEKKQLVKERNQCQKAEKTLTERSENLKQENGQLKQQIKTLEKKVDKLQSDRDDEHQRLKQQLDNTRQEIQDKEAQHSRDIQSLNDVKRNYSKELTERQAQVQRLKDQLEEKSTLLKKAEADRKQQKDHQSKTQERARQAEMQLVEVRTELGLRLLERTKLDAETSVKLIEDRLALSGMTDEERSRLNKEQEAWLAVKAECVRGMDEARAESAKHQDAIKEGKLASQLPRISIAKPPGTPAYPPPLPPVRPPHDLIHTQQQQQLQQKFLNAAASAQPNAPPPASVAAAAVAPLPPPMASQPPATPAPPPAQLSPPLQLAPPPVHAPPPPHSAFHRPMSAIQAGPPPHPPFGAPPFGNGSLHNQHMAPYMSQQRAPSMMFPPSAGSLPPPPIGSRAGGIAPSMPEPFMNKFDSFDHAASFAPDRHNRSGTPAELEQAERVQKTRSLWEKDLSAGPSHMNSTTNSVDQIQNAVNAAAAKFFPTPQTTMPDFAGALPKAAVAPGSDGADSLIRNRWGGDSIWSFGGSTN